MVPSLARRAPFQFAFVVRDLDRFVAGFDRVLRAGPWRGWVFGPQGQGREYRGAPAEWTLRLVLNSRSPQFEVIQPLDGPSVHADWLEERGEGFHTSTTSDTSSGHSSRQPRRWKPPATR
jgi:hypothetical protein